MKPVHYCALPDLDLSAMNDALVSVGLDCQSTPADARAHLALYIWTRYPESLIAVDESDRIRPAAKDEAMRSAMAGQEGWIRDDHGARVYVTVGTMPKNGGAA